MQTQTMAPSVSNPAHHASTNWSLLFSQLEQGRLAREPRWLRAVRKSAMAHFAEWDFPTVANEEWRYTSLASLNEWPCRIADAKPQLDSLITQPSLMANGAACYRLVFVNGRFSPARSTTQTAGADLELTSLAWATTQRHAIVESCLGRLTSTLGNPMVSLNSAFFADGALIVIPTNYQVDKPILIEHFQDSTEPQSAVFPRHLIVAAPGSQATVLESYTNTTGSNGPMLVNPVTEIVVGAGAVLEHCRLQDEGLDAYHVGAVLAEQDSRSTWKSHVVSAGARLCRLDIYDRLQGEGAESLLNGLYLAQGDQLVDHHTAIDHVQPHCNSHEFYHGILGGHSKGVFNGKIYVRPGAQKTDAKQTNRNLLLSDDATVNTKPQLEIFADDVKCTHGATVGHLDEESLFYLRSRGIGAAKAQTMLIQAFASEIVNRITHPDLKAAAESWLAGKAPFVGTWG
jgi:Fe-S cluster assembly protein SufD